MRLKRKLASLKYSIRWNLFITLGLLMFICQTITVFWLWFESKEQIEVMVDLTLNKKITDSIVRKEEFEAVMVLLFSTFTIMLITLLLAYQAIKRITNPLEQLQKKLSLRTAENLTPINSLSQMNEIKSITQTLNGLFIRLDETLQQERLFTADVAHELRTPLAGIRLHLELLERNENIDCQDLIERIDRLVNTVEQLLALARSSQKFISGTEQVINFQNDIFNLLNSELNDMVKTKQQILIWQLSAHPLLFKGECTLICLLLRNLVENSSRYSPTNSQITINCSCHQQKIVIEVIDEGIGIDESKLSYLTQAFFRMDRRHKGVGLGLSIVSRIIKLHRGELIIKNRDNTSRGTCVKCILPILTI